MTHIAAAVVAEHERILAAVTVCLTEPNPRGALVTHLHLDMTSEVDVALVVHAQTLARALRATANAQFLAAQCGTVDSIVTQWQAFCAAETTRAAGPTRPDKDIP